jgi:hypothetical protein
MQEHANEQQNKKFRITITIFCINTVWFCISCSYSGMMHTTSLSKSLRSKIKAVLFLERFLYSSKEKPPLGRFLI